VKLLLDENLSRRLVPALQTRFPGTSQVALLGLERSTDYQLCEYASENGFVLVSKDDDFQALVAARAYRPKLIRLVLGNATNDQVLAALLGAADHIENALSQTDIGIAVIDRTT
jgi:predicted nuclease of predicted toxin-antitoxin system